MRKLPTKKVWLIAACSCLSTPVLTAQQPPSMDAGARKFYEELIRTPIVPQRSAAEIQSDLTDVGEEMQRAEKSIADAQGRTKEADGWLATHKTELEGLKDKIGNAKKEKREADKVALEAQREQLELVDDYLKKVKATRDAELDLAKAQRDLLSSEMKVFQAESDLGKKAEGIRNAASQDPGLSKLVLDAAQAGESTLRLQKIVADKNQDVAGRLARLADRRIDLVQSRNKLLSEERIRQAAASMKK